MKLLICTQAVDKNHPILGFFHRWIEEFSKNFDEVHVICLIKGEYTLPSNVRVYSLGKEEGENKFKYMVRFYKYFSDIFFNTKVDFVFYHMGAVYNILGAPFFFFRKFYKTKFYWWKTHGTLNLLGRIASIFIDRVYTASTQSFPMQTKKKFVVGHAVDTAFILQERKTQTPPTVLFVGRVTPRKKLEYLIEAIHELRARGVVCTLRIVGVLPDDTYKQMLMSIITKRQLEDVVQIIGPKKHSELDAEYNQASVLVNPSETGSIDKVVLEAMVRGLPVVALKDAYGDLLDQFNLSVAKQDAQLYADRIEQILKHEKTENDLSSALREEVIAHHSLSTITQRIFNI